MQSASWEMLDRMKHKLESRLLEEISITLDADYITLTAESKELKSLLMIVKEERGKSWLKTQHSETKIIASGPITSWQIDGETVEIVTDCLFIYFFGPQITADGDYSHEIERYLSLKEKLSPT